MDIQQAIDEIFFIQRLKKYYSEHTFNGYSYDLKSFETFLETYGRSTNLVDLNRSIVRRYIQLVCVFFSCNIFNRFLRPFMGALNFC